VTENLVQPAQSFDPDSDCDNKAVSFGSILVLAGIGHDKDGAVNVSEHLDDWLIQAELEKWQR
jgi:hypothetical protein